MTDRELVGGVLDLVLVQRADDARARLDRRVPFQDAVDGYVTFLAALPDQVARPVPAGADPTTLLLATAVDVLAGAVDPDHDAATSLAALPGLAGATDPTCALAAFARYVAVEAALASARLDVAQQVLAGAAFPHELWSGHPYAGVMRACVARVAVFSGNVDRALEVLTATAPPPGMAGDLVRATHALAAGNAADVDTMRRLVAEVQVSDPPPVDRLGRGIHLLLAFGVVALGDTAAAVRHLLRAGGGADLELLTIIDRALGHEMLVAAAVDEGDLEAALVWVDRALPLTDHRAAAPTVARLRSRAALLAGDFAAAEKHAERAVALAAAEARAVERAEAEIVLARARIAGRKVPDAARDLRAAVASADSTGHRAVREAATRELRPARRRLPPVAGAGRVSLSAREREIADLILAGADNAEIAARLHLSPATVRAHASRVLAAFGVATRIGLLAQAHRDSPAPGAPSDLTARQGEVAHLVAGGRTNAEIAALLGIGVKSVEKHVSDVLVRWQLSSRFELAHRWWQQAG